jgi:hypothetical protein
MRKVLREKMELWGEYHNIELAGWYDDLAEKIAAAEAKQIGGPRDAWPCCVSTRLHKLWMVETVSSDRSLA